MEETVEAPDEINVQNAIRRFIKGNVMANPDSAIAPTPCPIKILSMM
jgi:hypothetical protein